VVHSYISSFKDGLTESPAIIPGWDVTFNLEELLTISCLTDDDQNKFSQAI
jgi:hypothetical protein